MKVLIRLFVLILGFSSLGVQSPDVLAAASSRVKVSAQSHPTRTNSCTIKGMIATADAKDPCACISFGQIPFSSRVGLSSRVLNRMFCVNSQDRSIRKRATDASEGQEPMPLAKIVE